MIERLHARIRIPLEGVLLTITLTLFIFGLASAQSQLAGIPLTTDPAQDLRPAWSPDGTQIAFFSSRSGNNDIWVMNADGSNQHQLTTDPADDRRPAWSPDGSMIAIDSDRDGSRDIWVMDAECDSMPGGCSANLRQVTNGSSTDSFAAWSPDGNQIAFYAYEAGVMDIWVAGLDDFTQGGAAAPPRAVTNSLADEKKNNCTFACHSPAWSPDGTQIAYGSADRRQIWVVDADGSDPHAVIGDESHNNAHFPWWTPDGRLVYLQEYLNQEQSVNDIWVMNADGNNATLLFEGVPHGGPLIFRPDGATIVFHSPRAGNFDIYTTVLGQEPAAIIEASVATEVPSAPQVTVETSESTPAAAPATLDTTAPESTGAPDTALVLTVGIAVLGGALLTLYFVRRGR